MAEGLRLGFAGMVQGPTVVTARLRLLSPNRSEMSKLLSSSFANAAAQALHVGDIRIIPSERGVLLEIPSPQPRTPTAEDLARHTRALSVCLGLDQWRQPVSVSLDEHPHWLAIGPSGRGKTEALKSALYGLCKALPSHRLRYIILARKRAAWADFEREAHCGGVLNRPDDISEALSGLRQVLNQRTETGQREPALIVVADDLANLAGDIDMSPLEDLASMGREPRLFLWASTQTDGKNGGLSQPLASNMRLRLVFGGSSASDAARFAGAGGLGAEAAGKVPGDCVLVRDGQAQRIATALSGHATILQLEQRAEPLELWKTARTAADGGYHDMSRDILRDPLTPQNRSLLSGAALPLDLSREPTTEEQALIKAIYAETGGSKSETARRAYGHKNGKTWRYIEMALDSRSHEGNSSPITANSTYHEPPLELDLSTSAGRSLFAQLQAAGGLRFASEVAT